VEELLAPDPPEGFCYQGGHSFGETDSMTFNKLFQTYSGDVLPSYFNGGDFREYLIMSRII